MAPQLLGHRQGQEGLRRRPVLLPVLLVLRPDALEVHRERRVPVGQVLRLRDARILGHEVAVGGEPNHGHDARHRQVGGARLEPAFVLPDVVVEGGAVARPSPEVRGGPGAEQERALSPRPHPATQRPKGCVVEPRHQRVGHRTVPHPDRVRQVDEGFRHRQPRALRGLARRRRHAVVEEGARAFEGESALAGQRAEPEAQVLETRRPAKRRPHIAGTGHQDRVRLPLLAEAPLQEAQRNEERPHFLLPRLQRELAEIARGQHRLQGEPDRPPRLVPPAKERAARDIGRRLDAEKERRAGGAPHLASERLAGEGIALLGAGRRPAVESPEPLVHPVDQHVARTAAARLFGHDAGQREERTGLEIANGPDGPDRRRQILRQTLAERARADDRLIGRPKPLEGALLQAPPHRFTDEQGARQHRYRGGDAEDDRNVRARRSGEGCGGPGSGSASSRLEVLPHEAPAFREAPARSALWVTTTRIVCSRRCRSQQDRRDRLRGRGVEVAGRLVAQEQRGLRAPGRAPGPRAASRRPTARPAGGRGARRAPPARAARAPAPGGRPAPRPPAWAGARSPAPSTAAAGSGPGRRSRLPGCGRRPARARAAERDRGRRG